MPKHQYLISKYHWKIKKNVINLSADSAFSFSGIGSKTKSGIGGKHFIHYHETHTHLIIQHFLDIEI